MYPLSGASGAYCLSQPSSVSLYIGQVISACPEHFELGVGVLFFPLSLLVVGNSDEFSQLVSIQEL